MPVDSIQFDDIAKIFEQRDKKTGGKSSRGSVNLKQVLLRAHVL